MSERFWELSEERRQAVLNAALEVFAKHDYKRASTDLIAAKAGISKGLLFYYFRNKKALYLAAYEHAERVTHASIVDPGLLEITDFFELLRRAAIREFAVLRENPYAVSLALRSFYSEKEEVSQALKAFNAEAIDGAFEAYFGNVDFGKFREDVDPKKIFRMLVWLSDGYLHERQMRGEALELDEIERTYDEWLDMFRRMAYKEEYL